MTSRKTFFVNLIVAFSLIGILSSGLVVVSTYVFGLDTVSRYAFIALRRLKVNSEQNNDILEHIIKLNSTSKITKYFPAYNWNPALHGLNEEIWISRPSSIYTIRKDEGSGIIPYKTNKLGHRLTVNENLNKPIDVIFIGDSFTEGCCVSTGNTTPDYYAKISGKNVINLGISGTGPLRQLSSLIEFIHYVENESEVSFSKDARIIWNTFTGNDLHNLSKEKSTPLKMYMTKEKYISNYYSKIKSVTESQKLFLNKILVDPISKNNAMMDYYNSGNTINRSLIPLNLLDYEIIVRKIIEICSDHNLDLKIVLLSDYPSVGIGTLSELVNQKMKSMFKELDFINFQEYSLQKNLPRKLENDPLGRIYGHFDEIGYKKFAEFIFEGTTLK